MLIDSTVFIDYLRGKKQAQKFLLDLKKPVITSVIVVMEITAGFSRRKDIEDFQKLLETFDIEVVHISSTVSFKALEIFNHYYHTGIGISDSFIATTAFEERQPIATHNVKHFSQLIHFDIIRPY